MKINWPAFLLWFLLVGVAAGTIYGRLHIPAEQVVPPPAQTVPAQPPVVVPPVTYVAPVAPKPRYRPVTKPPVHALAHTKRAYVPAYKAVPGALIDCKQVPQIARSIPWGQVLAAARARGMSAAEINQLRVCLGAE